MRDSDKLLKGLGPSFAFKFEEYVEARKGELFYELYDAFDQDTTTRVRGQIDELNHILTTAKNIA